ncbi:SPOR domain-containing protein [Algoriphagus aestuariicola]|uniref:SPOR domain-containing protein n=1 Tax=Algoriphagus aestuariicola TaxID=1852016 RepID=A0ABS3BNF4_9BACT|nr:SPOR domain-containing protein [Algoriphagus aestuariicola]MBN7800848.1 SPOR domain-containing protein [Algoriphagus aestuariicola]
MSAKDTDKKQWTDPKDFGLPYVEIIPLRLKVTSEEGSEPLPAESPVPDGETSVSAQIEAVPAAKPSPAAEALSPSARPQPTVAKFEKKEEKEKSSSWVWAVALIGLGIVAVIIWQILANQKPRASEAVLEVVDQPVETASEESNAISTETTPTDQNQIDVNQDSITTSTISNPNISNPAETGTTIATTASGNLIRVESKAERPQYFIIVGSLPNEKMALEEANQYFGRNAEIYLISPYDGGRNYRLALSKYPSFKAAAEQLEEIKSQYTEELWILKY